MMMRCFACCLAVAIAAAQSGGPVRFRSTTRLVQLNVVVRDHSGAVGDLKKEDFVLFDGKKPRPVAMFAVETAKSVIPGAMPQLPTGVFVNSMQRHAATPTNVSVVL